MADNKKLLPVEIRKLYYQINVISDKWKGGTPMELEAIKYGITAFHKFLCESEDK